MTTLYKKRLWLNKNPKLSAYIVSQVEVYQDVYCPLIHGSVKIADCTDTIELEFDVDGNGNHNSDAWFKEKIAKLDKLIKVFTETKEAMLKAKVKFDKAVVKSKKKKKK